MTKDLIHTADSSPAACTAGTDCVRQSTSVAVIGAGHAGIEAALASARMGVDTVLFTMSLDTIANMPCNPSIGGTAKGHLVYEIDALGGEMGYAADLVTLQSRTLNLGKGAAVQSKRVQADRKLYQKIMKQTLENTPNLRIVQAEIVRINTQNLNGDSDADGLTEAPNEIDGNKRQITSVTTRLGETWACQCAIVATGTYLEGAVFVGDVSYESGPDGLLPAKGLSASLRENGIRLVRFKTGTPARVKRSTIDFSTLELQPGESPILPYSVRTDPNILQDREQIPCHIVYTNAETHRIIRENITRSAMYSGKIHGTGPRYCPSIEDKLVRFADKERHQLFVEPMGENTEEMYIQGFSTSLPTDVQHRMLASLNGFSKAEIMRYAYAIEYDCADPTQMDASLEFKSLSGLFGAGQFNGTSGYEEAAAQGLIAGINAARKVQGRAPVILSRSSGYIGTLIDDLVTKGTNEPYRMMTSRSEYRLLLRQDNADLRLTPIGYEVGLIRKERYRAFLQKKEAQEAEKKRLCDTYLSPEAVNRFLHDHGEPDVRSGISLADLLRRPGITYEMLSEIDPAVTGSLADDCDSEKLDSQNMPESDNEPGNTTVAEFDCKEYKDPCTDHAGGLAPASRMQPRDPRAVLTLQQRMTVEYDIKYAGYASRQLADVVRQQKLEEKKLPDDMDYLHLKGLRIEAAQKLDRIRPKTLGQASRISGVNPADVSVLMIVLGIH